VRQTDLLSVWEVGLFARHLVETCPVERRLGKSYAGNSALESFGIQNSVQRFLSHDRLAADVWLSASELFGVDEVVLVRAIKSVVELI
jgi:hypothetical protein